MLRHFWFDFAMTFYAIFGAGVGCYLWKVGRRPWTWQRPVPVPELDPAAFVIQLHDSGDVGWV